MRIKLKKVLNIIGGFVERGNTVDLPELNAKKLVAMGWAEAADEQPAVVELPAVVAEVVKEATPRRYKRHDQEDQEATE